MTISWLSGKRRAPVSQREAPELTEWLDAIPEEQPLSRHQAAQQRRTGVVRIPPATLIFNTRNQAFTESGLGQALAARSGNSTRRAQLIRLSTTFTAYGTRSAWSYA
jgi:hypothetical protein